MQYAIETDGLSKTYRGGIQALKSLSLQVPIGCCFGLLGPNGAGKSTLIKTLLSIVHATTGDATLLGRPFRTAEARRGVGYLAEGHNYPRYLTGYGVCAYFGHLSGLGGIELDNQIKKILELVGMSEWATTKISKYSKGMNQRVGLAQALLGNPKLVFLDEPTDGVDPLGRQEIRKVIKRIADEGTTVFLNSHLLSEVEQTCDHIAIMHKGELIQQGSVAQITAVVSGKQDDVTVRFRSSKLPGELWAKLTGQGATRDDESGFTLSLKDEQEISGWIDQLRAAGVEIYEVAPVQINLEDAFISLITAEEEGAQA